MTRPIGTCALIACAIACARAQTPLAPDELRLPAAPRTRVSGGALPGTATIGRGPRCGDALVPHVQGGCCAPSDLACAIAAGRTVLQPARFDDPAPAEELGQCARDCALGNAEHCFRAAESYRQGVGAKPDVQRAGRLFADACRLELAEACHELWELFRRDRRVVVTAAVRAFEAECELGHSLIRCASVADAYEHGWGVPRDRRRARAIDDRTCRIVCDLDQPAEKKSCMRYAPECRAAVRLGHAPY